MLPTHPKCFFFHYICSPTTVWPLEEKAVLHRQQWEHTGGLLHSPLSCFSCTASFSNHSQLHPTAKHWSAPRTSRGHVVQACTTAWTQPLGSEQEISVASADKTSQTLLAVSSSITLECNTRVRQHLRDTVFKPSSEGSFNHFQLWQHMCEKQSWMPASFHTATEAHETSPQQEATQWSLIMQAIKFRSYNIFQRLLRETLIKTVFPALPKPKPMVAFEECRWYPLFSRSEIWY